MKKKKVMGDDGGERERKRMSRQKRENPIPLSLPLYTLFSANWEFFLPGLETPIGRI